MGHYHVSVKVAVKSSHGETRASAHYAYLGRTGSFEKLRSAEELVKIDSGNMPSWAQADPSVFWLASDTFERKNGSVYRELEASLPRELSPEQHLEIIDAFRTRFLVDHPFTLAIHIKKAADGGSQPHVHLMWSERKMDGVDREPELFFKRAAALRKGKSGIVRGDLNPAKGGCKKVSMQPNLIEFREFWATLTNEAYRKAGLDERVSHLSLAAQGIKRDPERHLGPIRMRGDEGLILLERREARRTAELLETEALAIMERLAKAQLRQAQVLDMLMIEPYNTKGADRIEQLPSEVSDSRQDSSRASTERRATSIFSDHRERPIHKASREPKIRAYSPQLVRARAYRTAFLIEQYGYSSHKLANFWRIQRNPRSREIVYFQKGGRNRVSDKGVLITAEHGNPSEIEVIVELAKLKKWPSVVFSGTASFKLNAMLAGLHAGLNVLATNPNDKILLEQARKIMLENHGVGTENGSIAKREFSRQSARKSLA